MGATAGRRHTPRSGRYYQVLAVLLDRAGLTAAEIRSSPAESLAAVAVVLRQLEQDSLLIRVGTGRHPCIR